jgi:hypothetical protein
MFSRKLLAEVSNTKNGIQKYGQVGPIKQQQYLQLAKLFAKCRNGIKSII